MKGRAVFAAAVILLAASAAGLGADSGDTEKTGENSSWSIVPIGAPYYTTDTGFAIGASIIFARPDQNTGKSDEIAFAASASTEKQYSAVISPDIYFQNGKILWHGEYELADSPSDFYGLGNTSNEDDRVEYRPGEFFGKTAVLFAITGNIYAGPLYRLRYVSIDFGDENLPDHQKLYGTDGAFESGAGAAIIRDTRHGQFYPFGGSYMKFELVFNHGALGSEFDFTSFETDLRYFRQISGRHVAAFQFKSTLHSGDTPFRSLAGFGSSEIMRGVSHKRYLDNNSAAVQAEYRFPVFWRIGGVVYASAGSVADTPADLPDSSFRYAGGGGIRVTIDREQDIAIRCDAAYADNGEIGLYFLAGEAF